MCLGSSPDTPHPLVDFQNTSGSHGPWEVNVNFGVLKIPPGFGGSGRSFPQKMPKLPYRSLQQYSPSVEIKNPLWSSGGVEQKTLQKNTEVLIKYHLFHTEYPLLYVFPHQLAHSEDFVWYDLGPGHFFLCRLL